MEFTIGKYTIWIDPVLLIYLAVIVAAVSYVVGYLLA